mmetsp:Transcript_90596/g.202438  ORF Transcript_90596/g.202438 Transcript_90596/m.202438 type:complete len:883 (-) Transcript_90596:144-2792(-)
MNVGIPALRRPAVQQAPGLRDPTRPRSPEGKVVGGARPRSPALKQPQAERGGACSGARQAATSPHAGSGGGSSIAAPSFAPSSRGSPQHVAAKRGTSTTVEEIKRIDMNREQRRRNAEEARRSRQEEERLLGMQCGGNVPDIDFHRMIRDFRQQCPQAAPFEAVDHGPNSIAVCVRKRPLQPNEVAQRELDCATAVNPYAIIHEQKYKVDGITKCLESHQFEFDRVFDEEASTEDVYRTVAQPLVPWVIEQGGRVTVFAYGQTGSGKTHTMTGLQRQLANQIFEQIRQRTDAYPLEVSVSFFEIYGGQPYDLLNGRQRLETLEDAKNEVQIAGLTERDVGSPEAMLQCIELGNSLRTTHTTAMNRDSSRSHAICNVFIRSASSSTGIHAKVTLVDLAGSERAAESNSSIRQRRVEGAQINKSLLALKECIRAMGDPREAHVPFRASKLTLVLRDAFVSQCPSRTVMIACIAPGMTSADHSINTLRYSTRLKDHPRASRPMPAGGLSTEEVAITEASLRRHSKSPGPGRCRSRSPDGLQGPGRHHALMAPHRQLVEQEAFKENESIDLGSTIGPSTLGEDHGEEFSATACEDQGAPTEAAPSSLDTSGRHLASRRGRQSTLRPTEAGAPSQPDAIGSRAQRSPQRQPTQLAQPPTEAHGDAALAQQAPGREGRNATGRDRSPELASRRAARQSGAAPPPPCGAGDLHCQDDRYLHNTLTSEVVGRRSDAGGGNVVDVGVEDLEDLAHMEVLDEVRQWEDRIVSQHMVALQEDARLLTAESELLSKVQQGTFEDIDRYVSEVEKVVRRKMEVYEVFLDDLEVFKAQLRREESLSRSCKKDTRSQGAGGEERPLLASARGDANFQAHAAPGRTPRTPRMMALGSI